MSSSQAVVKKDSAEKTAVAVPDGKMLATPKEVRQVLTEEKYLGMLDTIIQRDYFPDVPKLKAQLEYLKAVDHNDVAKIRELQLRYSTKRTERRTSPTRRGSPDMFDPPDDTPKTRPGTSKDTNEEGDNDATASNRYNNACKDAAAMNVDAFLAKYTSEDNASFEELAAIQEQKERIRLAWMYNAEQKHNESLVTRTQGNNALKGADEQFALPDTDRPRNIDNWTYKAHNSVLFHPDDAPLTSEDVIERKKMNQRVIHKDATRFRENPWKEQLKTDTMNKAAAIHAAAFKGRVDVSGQVAAGFQQPGQQFSMVVTPSPAPGVAESPMMTWGEIEGSPFRLDASDIAVVESGPVFKIPEVPLRDKLAQEMTDTIGRRYREKRERAVQQAEALHTKTPRFGSKRSTERLGTMSPAARRLATTKLGIRMGSDKALKASYTPSPSRSTPSSRTPKQMRTPVDKKPTTPAPIPTSSITDNLLDLTGPGTRRPAAADYF